MLIKVSNIGKRILKTINNFEDNNGLELIRSVIKMFNTKEKTMTIKYDEITIFDGRYDVFSEQLRGSLEILGCPNTVVTSSELIIMDDDTIINTYASLETGEEVNGSVSVPSGSTVEETDDLMEILVKDIIAKCLTVVYTHKYFLDADEEEAKAKEQSSQCLFEDEATGPVEVIKLFED